jgi:hypothetical protein
MIAYDDISFSFFEVFSAFDSNKYKTEQANKVAADFLTIE